jgi:hypothetical protein
VGSLQGELVDEQDANTHTRGVLGDSIMENQGGKGAMTRVCGSAESHQGGFNVDRRRRVTSVAISLLWQLTIDYVPEPSVFHCSVVAGNASMVNTSLLP